MPKPITILVIWNSDFFFLVKMSSNMHFALVVQYQIDSTKPSGLLSWEPDHSGHCPGPVCTSRVRGKASLQRHSLPKSSLLIFFICPLKSHLQALATRVLRVGHTEARREGKQKGKSECMGGGGAARLWCCHPELSRDTAWQRWINHPQNHYFSGKCLLTQ